MTDEVVYHVGDGGGEAHRRPGQHRRSTPTGTLTGDLIVCRHAGDVVLAAARPRRLHGRVAQAARLGRRGADPVPRERRRQPRADGLEHAAPGGAAGAGRRAAGRHRHGGGRRPRFRRGDRARGAPASSTRSTRTRIVIRATDETDPAKPGVDIYRLIEVPALQPDRPASTSGRWCGSATGSQAATSSPTVRRPISAIWRSAATCSSRSCPGTATTSRTRSCSPSASSRTTSSPRSTSRSSRSMARDTKLGPGGDHPRHPQRLAKRR